MLEMRGNSTVVVQLGGLEPPTSCSTDRRSNQLSYNCIARAGPKKGSRMGGKLGATPAFGKAAKHPIAGRFQGAAAFTPQQKARAPRPGFSQKNRAEAIRRPACSISKRWP